MEGKKAAALLAAVAAVAVAGVFMYYFYTSDCCIIPSCSQCLWGGQLTCRCGQYLQQQEYGKICEECHVGLCGTGEAAKCTGGSE